jgi:hypothetical protein
MKSNQEVEKEVLDLLNNVNRNGMQSLIAYLQGMDFFTAPASVKWHDTFVGGLAYHSLLTYKILKDKVDYYGLTVSEDTIRICGLLHDLCKVDYYKRKEFEPVTDKQVNYLKSLLAEAGIEGSAPYEKMSKTYASKLIGFLKGEEREQPSLDEPEWDVDDILPLGHGEKSIFVLQRFIQLTNEEAISIRWHMSFSDPGVHFFYPSGKPHKDAIDKYPLTILLYTSDFEARMCSDLEKKEKQEK